MEKLTLALCDDDPAFRAVLRCTAEKALAENGLTAEVFEAGAGSELAVVLDHRSFDLILLDIDMPGMDGIRFGEELRARGCRSDIIYVSNMDEKVYEIFRVHPWSFVRKSRFSQELPSVLGEYARGRSNRMGQLLLTGESGQTVSLDPASLIYAEAVGKVQRLVLSGAAEPILIRASLRELEEQLLPHGFIRIHKGFLVNYRYIKKITSRSVLLDTGDDLPVGRDRLNAARERYLSLMKWKGLSR